MGCSDSKRDMDKRVDAIILESARSGRISRKDTQILCDHIRHLREHQDPPAGRVDDRSI